MNKMLRTLAALAVLFLALPVMAAEGGGNKVQLVDRIVAVVNQDVITLFELNAQVKNVELQLQKRNTPPPPREVLERQVLERMINERVQLQLAAETGVRVDDVQLDRTVQRIAQSNNVTLEVFRRTLEKEGVSFRKFREDIRNEIIQSRLREREVDNKISISDGEVDTFLTTQDTQEGGGEDEYNISHILVTVPEGASPEQIQARRQRAESALADLKKGDSFPRVAAAYSEAADAMDGGQLGWKPAARLPGIFLEAVQKMKNGDTSEIVRSPNGFHIIRLVDRRTKGAALIVQKTKVRHILIKVNEGTSEADALSLSQQLRERLINGEDFGKLAKLRSEDGSAARGGDLGWISPGETVPDFERAMDDLKIDEISAPILTPFGWHLIQVQERKKEDVSRERRRLNAKQELRMRKSDEEFQEWLRQLRDRAFVDIRLEDRY